MSEQLTPALPLSFAARGAGEVHLQLQLPTLRQQLPEGSLLQLKRGGQRLEAVATSVPAGSGQVLICSMPSADLTRGTWQLLLRQGSDGSWLRVAAYLLLPPVGPVSLLLGQPSSSGLITTRRAPRRRRHIAALAGRGLDHALAPLGPRRARWARDQARRTARRLLS